MFLRICLSIDGQPGKARRSGVQQLFSKDTFCNILVSSKDYRKYFFGFKAFELLNELQRKYESDKNNRFGQAQFGSGLRYGKLAIAGVVTRKYYNESEIRANGFDKSLRVALSNVLSKWTSFERYVQELPYNSIYFRKYTNPDTNQQIVEANYDNYYKGRTLTRDLECFTW